MKLSWLWMFPEEASILMLGDLSQARPGAQIFMVRNYLHIENHFLSQGNTNQYFMKLKYEAKS